MRILSLLIPVLVLHPVASWGPLLHNFRAISTQLPMARMDDDEPNLDTYRAKLENTFRLGQDIDLTRGSLYHIDESSGEWVLDVMSSCGGEDCDECLIPEDLKHLTAFERSLDVMSFLGIRRAEPLTKRDVIRGMDWD